MTYKEKMFADLKKATAKVIESSKEIAKARINYHNGKIKHYELLLIESKHEAAVLDYNIMQASTVHLRIELWNADIRMQSLHMSTFNS